MKRIKILPRELKPFMSVVFLLLLASGLLVSQDNHWDVPSPAKSKQNPFLGDKQAIIGGKQTYEQLCLVCHGARGRGDGMAGITLKPRPSNFTKKAVQSQTDGALFWKITEGRPPMARYKEVLTEEQRWQLVNYIRTFGK